MYSCRHMSTSSSLGPWTPVNAGQSERKRCIPTLPKIDRSIDPILFFMFHTVHLLCFACCNLLSYLLVM